MVEDELEDVLLLVDVLVVVVLDDVDADDVDDALCEEQATSAATAIMAQSAIDSLLIMLSSSFRVFGTAKHNLHD